MDREVGEISNQFNEVETFRLGGVVVGIGEDGPGITGLTAGCFGRGDVLDVEDGGFDVIDFGSLGEEAYSDSHCVVLFGVRVILSGVWQEESTMEVSGKNGIGGEGRRGDAIDAIAWVREGFVDCRGYSAKRRGKRHVGFAAARSCGESV